MKIDTFFKKQTAQPVALGLKGKPDTGCSKGPLEPALRDNDTRMMVDVGFHKASGAPQEEHSNVDPEMRPNSAATNELRPLSEATNRQLMASATPKSRLDKPAAQVSAIDLCDSPSPAARPAQHGQHRIETPNGLAAAAKEQQQGDLMDVDAPGSPLQQLSDAATGLIGSEQRPQPQQIGPATSAEPVAPQVMLRSGSSDAPPGSAAVTTSTAKVSQQACLTPDQRKQLLQDCLQELPLLEAELDKHPDLSACISLECSNSSKKGGHLDIKHQVSILVEGQSLPLSQLAQHISSTLSTISSNGSGAGNPAADPSATAEAGTSSSQAAAEPHGAAAGAVICDAASALVVRNIIQDVASRKSYGLQDGALAPVDAFQDVTTAYHWCWELRSLTGLPKTIKQHADVARKHRKQVLDRLKACSAYIQLAQGFSKSTKTAEQKIAKAAAKLNKLQSLTDLQVVSTAAAEAAELSRQNTAAAAQEQAAREEQAAEAASAKADKARLAENDKAAKEAERAAKEAEKAAKVVAKAAEAEEKARQKAEEDRKREEARQQKAAEEARKKEQKAKLKEEKKAAKKGFHSAQEMQKSQKVFMSFLKKEPRPVAPPSGPSADDSHGQSGSQHQHQQPFEPVGGGGPSEQQVALMQQLDQGAPVSSRSSNPQPVPELLAMLMRHWKVLGKQRHRSWGLPPSWARRPDAASDPDHIAATAEALYGEGIDLSTLRCWRRKLIKHNDSVRPAYYGSWSRQSRCVSGRKPFGQDVEVEYEVMSDQDWEEEPEGESLSDDAEDEEEAAADEAEEDEEGFVVGDGYLSEDEGLRDEDGDTVMVPTAGGCTDADKDPIEAAQERAKARGRYVVLAVNDIVPNLAWEPTTNLDPAQLLASLKATVFTPEITPLQPWEHLAVQIHGRPASAGTAPLARAASIDAACGTALTAADPDTATAAAVAASTGGASGPGRRQSMFPEDMLGALVQHIQGNSALGIDKLTDQFVESLHGACFTGKLTKKSVRDKIRQVTTLKKGRTACYAVKPEYVAAVGAAAGGGVSPTAKNVPTGVWGVKYKEEAATETPAASPTDTATAADAMVVENAGEVQEQQQQIAQQQQQPEAQHAPDLPAAPLAQGQPTAVPTALTGVKRPASAGVVPPAAETPATNAAPQQQSTQPTPAADVPPTKKQKTPGGGIERFFVRPKQQAQQQQLASVNGVAAPGSREQQDKQQEQQEQQTPPSTPKHAGPASADAGATEDCPSAAAAAAHGNHSGVLPMLTPPSVDAADRPAVPHSPVPFRLNAAAADGDESTEKPQHHSPQQQRAPINRWHAQADCRGMSLQGGSTSSMPQQQQQEQQQQPSEQQNSDQPFGGFGQQQHSEQQQQEPPFAFTKASDLLGAGAGSAAVDASPGNLVKPALQVPQLPEDGSAPDSRFWKQLGSWIVCVRDPSQSDIDTALAVFGEQHLEQCIHNMPQAVMAAIVKSLGSYSQSLPMRVACARCISNVAQCLASKQQQTQQAGTNTPQKAGPPSPAAAAGGPNPSLEPSPSPAVASASPSTSLKRKFAASPSPSTSPRSAPVAVSFAELCAEPLLLSNLLLSAREPSGQLDDILKRVGEGAGGTLDDATVLSRTALRAVAALTGVGLPHPVTGSKEFCPAAAAAAAEVRLRIASTPNWKGVFMAAVGGHKSKISSPDRSRSTFALMALHHILSDAAATSQLLNKAPFSKRLAKCVMKRGADAHEWVVKKWTLLVSSLLLSDELYQSWVLPTEGLSQFHQQQRDDEEIVAALGQLLAGCINRPQATLSEPGADRIILGKSLTLTNLLVTVLGQQLRIPGNTGKLPNSVASLVGGGFAGSEQEEGVLVGALKEVAMQDDWEEAAARARHILEGLGSTSAGQDMEMEDAIIAVYRGSM